MPVSRASVTLLGLPGTPGRGVGEVVHAWEWGHGGPVQRVPAGQIPSELGCLARAFSRARFTLRAQLEALPTGARGPIEEALADLSDVVFLADVERLVLEEHLGARSAVAKVVGEVEQLFGPARAARAHELGTSVVRGLEGAAPAHADDAVIVARRLAVEDVAWSPRAAVTEEQQPAPRVVELARALRVPVVFAVADAVHALEAGAQVEVDGAAGQVRTVG
jgi:signal transduction protein with GAF and PtsI domain